MTRLRIGWTVDFVSRGEAAALSYCHAVFLVFFQRVRDCFGLYRRVHSLARALLHSPRNERQKLASEFTGSRYAGVAEKRETEHRNFLRSSEMEMEKRTRVGYSRAYDRLSGENRGSFDRFFRGTLSQAGLTFTTSSWVIGSMHKIFDHGRHPFSLRCPVFGGSVALQESPGEIYGGPLTYVAYFYTLSDMIQNFHRFARPCHHAVYYQHVFSSCFF